MTESHKAEVKDGKISPLHLRGVIEDLIEKCDYARLITITAIDAAEKFEVVYHIDVNGSITTVRVEIPRENPRIPTIIDLMPGALLFEREVKELFGIEFEGHLEPQHLLLPEDWPDGLYPLKKELTIEKVVEEVEEKQ